MSPLFGLLCAFHARRRKPLKTESQGTIGSKPIEVCADGHLDVEVQQMQDALDRLVDSVKASGSRKVR